MSNYLIGIDPSNFCIEKFNEINKNNMGFVCKDSTNIFFPDKSFDYVISTGTFHYFESNDYCIKVLEECKRIAKKGIYIQNIYESSNYKEHRTYPKIFFENLNYNIIVPNHYYKFNYQNHYDIYYLF